MPPPIVEGRIGYLVKRLQQAVRQELDARLRALGLTTPQYAALAALAGQPGLSGADLARACFVTPQTMQGILGSLDRAGLITRKPHPVHGKIVQSTLTGRGCAALKRAHDISLAVDYRMLKGLTGDEQRIFGDLFNRALVNLIG